MTDKNESPIRGIEHRFRDLSVHLREERLVRYIIHQVQSGRHINDIINDAHVVDHFDEEARTQILGNPEVIKSIEEQIRRQFADYGDSVGGASAAGGGQDSAGRASHDKLSDL